MSDEKYDACYLTRSDLSDEKKLEILQQKLAAAEEDILAGRVYSAEEVRSFLHKKYSSLVKQVS